MAGSSSAGTVPWTRAVASWAPSTTTVALARTALSTALKDDGDSQSDYLFSRCGSSGGGVLVRVFELCLSQYPVCTWLRGVYPIW